MTESEQFEAWWSSPEMMAIALNGPKQAAQLAWNRRASHPAPEGMVLVPIEPTNHMMTVGLMAMDRHRAKAPAEMNRTAQAAVCYRAMISAAPVVNQQLTTPTVKESLQVALKSALMSVNAVAIERGDLGVCDQIDKTGAPYQSQWLADLIMLIADPAAGGKNGGEGNE